MVNGTAPDRESALASFREAWTRFKAKIGPERYNQKLPKAEQGM
jgi:hypothetical protein